MTAEPRVCCGAALEADRAETGVAGLGLMLGAAVAVSDIGVAGAVVPAPCELALPQPVSPKMVHPAMTAGRRSLGNIDMGLSC
jgi:hypothetical protein